jgi:hypothetical protein
MESLLRLVEKMESVKEGVKAFKAGMDAIVAGRVAAAVAEAKAGMRAELESMGQRAADAEKKANDLLAGVESAVKEMDADTDEVVSVITVNTPAASEPAPSEAPAEAAVEAVSEEKKEGE